MSVSSAYMVEYLEPVVYPVADNAELFYDAAAVAVHVGEQLIRHIRSFFARCVLDCCYKVVIAADFAGEFSP